MTAIDKDLDHRAKVRHVDDFVSLAKVYLFDTGNPFEFRNEREKTEFMAKFLELGHDDVTFARCKCRGAKRRKWWS